MRYLLDTCAFLWLTEGNTRLSATARSIIGDAANEGSISTVSLWELSMKAVTGELILPMTPSQLASHASAEGLDVLPLTAAHVDRFHRISTTHRDPFDRLLAAIALELGMTFITPDSDLEVLGVNRIW